MKRRYVLGFVVCVALGLLTVGEEAQASSIGQYYLSSNGNYNSCQAYLSTPSSLSGNSYTVKALLEGRTYSSGMSIQCGWVYYAPYGMTTPEPFSVTTDPYIDRWVTNYFPDLAIPWQTDPGTMFYILQGGGDSYAYCWYGYEYLGRADVGVDDWKTQQWKCGIRVSQTPPDRMGTRYSSFKVRKAGTWYPVQVVSKIQGSGIANPIPWVPYSTVTWLTSNF